MIIELPNYVNQDLINKVRNRACKLVKKSTLHTYNREGKTVNISEEESLKDVETKLSQTELV
jgi:hypothetical protein